MKKKDNILHFDISKTKQEYYQMVTSNHRKLLRHSFFILDVKKFADINEEYLQENLSVSSLVMSLVCL